MLLIEPEEKAEHETMPVLKHLALMQMDSGESSDDEELNAFAVEFHADIDITRITISLAGAWALMR